VIDQDFEFDPLSWIDPMGRIFWSGGELYRGIRPARAELYRRLFDKGIVQDLVERKLLIDSSVADLSTAEFPLILQHHVVPVVSFPSEWCGSQLKAAALMVLDLEIGLRAQALTLDDVNPWNILFEGPQPVFVDFAAIAPLDDPSRWLSLRLFNEFFLNPLTLFERGLERLARRMLYDPWTGVTDYDIERIRTYAGEALSGRQLAYRTLKRIAKAPIPRRLRPAIKTGLRFAADAALVGSRGLGEPRDALGQILELRERVTTMAVEGPRSPWRKYYDNNFPDFEPSALWTDKHRSITAVIERLMPASLLDFGANRGWYSQMAARRGIRVIAADADEGAVNALYQDTVEAGATNLSTVYLDARFPEPAQGPAYQLFKPATERFNSEMVLSLAVIHHLVFGGNLNFEQIIRNFRAFCSKWLVVEFVGPTDPAVQAFPSSSKRPWYNESEFLTALSKHFNVIEILPSDSAGLHFQNAGPDDRKIFVCELRTDSTL
jgi:hypothetical protein